MTKYSYILILVICIHGCSFDKSSTLWKYNSNFENINYNLSRNTSYDTYKENIINFANNSEFPDINTNDE